MTPFVYIVLGIVLTLIVFAILMPNYRRYPRHYIPEWRWGHYYGRRPSQGIYY